MKLQGAANLPIVMGILGALGGRPLLAAGRACPPMAVEADGNVLSRWPELPERIRGAFDAREDIDACARVKLAMSRAAIAVEVILPDGRSASRSVSRREDVIPMLEALLLMPQNRAPPMSEVEPPTPPVAAAASSPNIPAAARPPNTDRDAPKKGLEVSPNRLRIELSALAAARIGDGQRSLGLGVLSFLDIAGWLVGFGGRADGYQRIAGEPSGAALELAVLGGRRFRFRTLALDLTAGPALALQGTAISVTESAPAGEEVVTQSKSTTSTVPRLLFGARLHFAARSVVGTFVGFDGEFGPSPAPSLDPTGDGYRFPRWTVGLALGATVGTL